MTFKAGNPGGPGNPFAGRVQELRKWAWECTTKDTFREVWDAMVGKARDGDVPAMREFFQRTMGNPIQLAYEEGAVPKDGDTIATIKIIHTSDGKAKSVVIPEEPSE